MSLHPTIAAALAPFAPPAESPAMQQYRKALRAFDWQYEFTDEFARWQRARAELTALYDMQIKLDPTGDIWNAVAPEGHGIPRPMVVA